MQFFFFFFFFVEKFFICCFFLIKPGLGPCEPPAQKKYRVLPNIKSKCQKSRTKYFKIC